MSGFAMMPSFDAISEASLSPQPCVLSLQPAIRLATSCGQERRGLLVCAGESVLLGSIWLPCLILLG